MHTTQPPTRRGSPTLTLLCAAALLVPTSWGQTAFIARDGATGTSTVLAVGPGASTVVAQGLRFLPVDLVGHPWTHRLRQDRPRRVDGPAATIRLPALGSLQRVSVDGGTALLQLGVDGEASLRAWTADGAGPGLSREVGVDDAGTVTLVSTGTGVLRIDLGSAAPPVDLTASLPPLDVSAPSLRASADHAWFVADGVLHHADLSIAPTAQALALPLLPGEGLSPELVMASDGSCVAVVTVGPAASQRLLVVDGSGGVTVVADGSSPVDLPSLGSPTGPLVVLDAPGSRVAWRATAGTRELFTRRLDQPTPTVQVTSDASFTDTIDNVGVLGFVAGGALLFVAGELPGPGDPPLAVGSADVYSLDLSSGGITNVSATAGDTSAPFLETGELEVQAAAWAPDGQRLLLQIDPDMGDVALIGVGPTDVPALQEITGPVVRPPDVVSAGGDVWIVAEGETGVSRWLRWTPGSGTTLLGQTPPGIALDRQHVRRDGFDAAAVASAGPGLELVARLSAAAGAPAFAWPVPFSVGPALGYATDGRLLSTLGLTGGPSVFAAFDVPGTGALLAVPKGSGFPLSP